MNRLEYCVLKLLRKKECRNYYHSMTIYEIIAFTGTARCTTTRHMQKLADNGYIDFGCKVGNAKTYYITEKGTEFLESNEQTA